MLKVMKILQQVSIIAWSTRSRSSLFTAILLTFATLVTMPSDLLGGSASTVGGLPKRDDRQSSITLTGKASYYPSVLDGHKTADGETFHLNSHTAASNRLPLGTDVKVTNLKNGRSTRVRVNDRGPALGNHRIDLSKKAATEIGLTRKQGTAPVEIKVIRKPANRSGRTSPSSATDATEARR
jgi:rare lipoprotein A